MKSFDRPKISLCVVLLIAGLFCCGFWGSTKKDIDVKGIKSVAVVPFKYTKFKNSADTGGEIVAENMNEIFTDRCEWNCKSVEEVKTAMKELRIREPLTQEKAAKLGERLGVDMVIFGSMPIYDERETSREVHETGGGFTENVRELKVEYNMFLMRISDGSLIMNIKMERKERDTAKDPMMPDPPEAQLKHATRRMAKKLVKRFIRE